MTLQQGLAFALVGGAIIAFIRGRWRYDVIAVTALLTGLALRRVLPLLKTGRSQVPVLTGVVTLLSMATRNVGALAIMLPVAQQVARKTGTSPSRLLMAVAFGAACDFLTPIGHQCNTMVMAPGGYRFGDYPRLGAPLSLMVLLVGPLLISWFWPLN